MHSGPHRVAMVLTAFCVGGIALLCYCEGSSESSAGTTILAASHPTSSSSTVGTTRDTIDRVPVTTNPFLTLEGQGNALTNGRYLVNYSLREGVANYWTWDELKPKPMSLNLGVKTTHARITGDLASLLYEELDQPTLALKRITPSETIRTWTIGKEWYCGVLAGEPNGRFVAVLLKDDFTVTHNFDECKSRLGLFDAKTGDLAWLYTYTIAGHAMVELAVPANQGGYIAVAASPGQCAMVDTAAKKLLWKLSLPETTFADVAFSPDDKTLYVPGTVESLMFAVDTVSGKVRSRWPADSSYGRFVSVVASPNGKWVAAGAGPGGDVCVWAVDTGKVVMHVKHADRATAYGVAFSPDSSLLATSGTHGNIQIWNIPK